MFRRGFIGACWASLAGTLSLKPPAKPKPKTTKLRIVNHVDYDDAGAVKGYEYTYLEVPADWIVPEPKNDEQLPQPRKNGV